MGVANKGINFYSYNNNTLNEWEDLLKKWQIKIVMTL